MECADAVCDGVHRCIDDLRRRKQGPVHPLFSDMAEIFVVTHRLHRCRRFADIGIAQIDHLIDGKHRCPKTATVADSDDARLEISTRNLTADILCLQEKETGLPDVVNRCDDAEQSEGCRDGRRGIPGEPVDNNRHGKEYAGDARRNQGSRSHTHKRDSQTRRTVI